MQGPSQLPLLNKNYLPLTIFFHLAPLARKRVADDLD